MGTRHKASVCVSSDRSAIDAKTIFFYQHAIPEHFVLKYARTTKIEFLYDQQRIPDLADFEQEDIFLVIEPDPVAPGGVPGNGYADIAIL